MMTTTTTIANTTYKVPVILFSFFPLFGLLGCRTAGQSPAEKSGALSGQQPSGPAAL
jgi:hypothetical protein